MESKNMMFNTNTPLQIKNSINNIYNTYDEKKEFLQYYQYAIRNYLIESDSRGLLIYHDPGYGKSILAASLADFYRKHDPKRQIIILLSKSLQSNLENNIKKYMRGNPDNEGFEKSDKFIDNIIANKYKFVSLNASNMYEQISNIKISESEKEFDKKLASFNKEIGVDDDNKMLKGSKNFLENSLIIIDEFHNLANSITNKSKNAINLYNALMRTKNIKMIFLTGTPLTNNPFECVPTFNLLRGYITTDGKSATNVSGSNRHTLFPENPKDFQNFFIKKNANKTLSINNKAIFQNRITGLVSYYGNFYFDKKSMEGFPQELPLKIERVYMSTFQFTRYMETRDIEKAEDANKFKKASQTNNGFVISDDSGKSSSSYRIRSRQVSNYYIPEYALTFRNARTSVDKHISKIKIDDLKNLDKYSPKFKCIIQNIDKFPNQLGIVYSEFVNGEGLFLFGRVLENAYNYKYWSTSKKFKRMQESETNEFDIDLGDNATSIIGGIDKQSHEKTYAIISGEISFLERQEILKIFNSRENINGNLISLLLLSKTGAEGLNLKNVRHIHICEPFWNYTRIEQVIARAVRMNAHSMLDKKLQTVQPFIYISIPPKGYKPIGKPEKTTDEELLHSALINKKLIDEFNLAIIESSIDCSLHYTKLESSIKKNFKCHLCSPTGVPLYSSDLYTDIKYDPCKELKQYDMNKTKSSTKDTKMEKDEESKVFKEIKVQIGENNDIENATSEETFYYYQDVNDPRNIKIFKFDENLNGYVPMKQSYPFYSNIIRKILKFD